MNRSIFSTGLLVILSLSHADQSWSQTAIVPDLPAPEMERLTHVPVKMPIRLYWGYLVIVEGSIGNVQKLHFLVDSGAYPSVIDQKIAHDLGLAEQPARVNLANKERPNGTRHSSFLTLRPGSRRIPSRSDGRPFVSAQGPRLQGGCNCRSGCPQEKQFYN